MSQEREATEQSGKSVRIPLLDFFGNLHGALKTPAQRYAYMRAFERAAEFEARNGEDLHDIVVQSRIHARAYAASKRAILMNDNAAVSAYRMAIKYLESKGTSGRVVGLLAKGEFPIVKVPTNLAIEAGEYIGGSVTGPVKLAHAIVTNGIDKLTPEEADSIMRSFKKGGIGLGLIALGYFDNPIVSSGGYYQKGQRKKEDLAFGQLSLFGVTIPKWASHIPMVEAIHFGKTLRHARDAGQGLGQAALSAGMGLAEEVPFFNTPVEQAKGLKEGDPGKVIGEYAKSYVEPQLTQQAGRYFDRSEQGTPISRKTEGFTDVFKEGSGIPALRRQLPETTTSLMNRALKGELTIRDLGDLQRKGELSPQTSGKVKKLVMNRQRYGGKMAREIDYMEGLPIKAAKQYVEGLPKEKQRIIGPIFQQRMVRYIQKTRGGGPSKRGLKELGLDTDLGISAKELGVR